MPQVALRVPAAALVPARCLHCGSRVLDAGDRFCCAGCETVHDLLLSTGLARFYALRGEDGIPARDVDPSRRRDHAALAPIARRVAEASGPVRVVLDVQGLHCQACVWLIETLFRRQPHAWQATVNPASGRVELVVSPGFDLDAFASIVEDVGYRLAPPGRDRAPESSDLLRRMGICIAIAMNAMLFAIATYAGLEAGPTYRLFQALSFVLATASVLVGGSVFARSAMLALRRGLLHLDLPIALGIALAYSSSTWAYFAGTGSRSFFDTITVFIALMLVGRFLQERVLARNRAQILASSGADGLHARVMRDGAVETIPCRDVRPGDRLLLLPGDLVPVDVVVDRAGAFSLDWISGESRPTDYGGSATVPAGAFSCNADAVLATAATAFDESPLLRLLHVEGERPSDAARATPFWQILARVYVAAVLALGVAAFALWMSLTRGDVTRSIEVVTAVFIITCPCAFGISTPLAYELVQAGLRRAGLFVRAGGFLDRATSVKRVVFDKTGTLTTGSLTCVRVDGEPSRREEEILFDLCARSPHPKSAAVRATLPRSHRLDETIRAREEPGRGIAADVDGQTYRLGAPAWVAPASTASGDVAFGVDGRLIASYVTAEEPRRDAAREVRALEAAGFEPWILSGDDPARVREMAARLGLPASRAIGGQSPEDKERWLRERDRGDVLFVGDGINDGLAAKAAWCSGTPAIDRPFMAARSDFTFVTPGLGAVRLALLAARRLSRVTRICLGVALAYNALTLTLAFMGLMSPLVCAIVMPLSSLSTVLVATLSLSKRSRLWRS